MLRKQSWKIKYLWHVLNIVCLCVCTHTHMCTHLSQGNRWEWEWGGYFVPRKPWVWEILPSHLRKQVPPGLHSHSPDIMTKYNAHYRDLGWSNGSLATHAKHWPGKDCQTWGAPRAEPWEHDGPWRSLWDLDHESVSATGKLRLWLSRGFWPFSAVGRLPHWLRMRPTLPSQSVSMWGQCGPATVSLDLYWTCLCLT